jgi:hypothetical protein
MIVSQESDSLVVDVVINDPQFRIGRRVGDFAT